MRREPLIVLAVAAALLAAPGAAPAQEPPPASPAAPAAEAEAAPAQPEDDETGLESRVGRLPFTPLDMIVLGGIALVITGAGWALLRLSEPRI
jgi:hypothetical protein